MTVSIGLGQVGSNFFHLWWFGLGGVTQNGPTDNSASAPPWRPARPLPPQEVYKSSQAREQQRCMKRPTADE